MEPTNEPTPEMIAAALRAITDTPVAFVVLRRAITVLCARAESAEERIQAAADVLADLYGNPHEREDVARGLPVDTLESLAARAVVIGKVAMTDGRKQRERAESAEADRDTARREAADARGALAGVIRAARPVVEAWEEAPERSMPGRTDGTIGAMQVVLDAVEKRGAHLTPSPTERT